MEGCSRRMMFEQEPELHRRGSWAHHLGRSLASRGTVGTGALGWDLSGLRAVWRPGWINQLMDWREHP